MDLCPTICGLFLLFVRSKAKIYCEKGEHNRSRKNQNNLDADEWCRVSPCPTHQVVGFLVWNIRKSVCTQSWQSLLHKADETATVEESIKSNSSYHFLHLTSLISITILTFWTLSVRGFAKMEWRSIQNKSDTANFGTLKRYHSYLDSIGYLFRLPSNYYYYSSLSLARCTRARDVPTPPALESCCGALITAEYPWARICFNLLRSTQLFIHPGSISRVPASAGVMAGTSHLSGGR